MVTRTKTHTLAKSGVDKHVQSVNQTTKNMRLSQMGLALERARQVSLARSHEEKSAAARLAIQHRDKKELEMTLKRARQISLARSHEEKSAAARLAIQHRDKKELERTLKKAREASLARNHEEKSKDARKAALTRQKALGMQSVKDKNVKAKQRSGIMKQALSALILTFMFVGGGLGDLHAAYNHRSEVLSTDAGTIDFSFLQNIKISSVYQKIHRIDLDKRMVELENGSLLSVSKIDSVKGWEQGKKLVITQNHATFSTSRYALVNLDLKLAVPASLIREPTPSQGTFFIKALDTTHDTITLNDNKSWIIHYADRGNLSKLQENDRIILGVNTGEDKSNNPYFLIDTSKNISVRAQLID